MNAFKIILFAFLAFSLCIHAQKVYVRHNILAGSGCSDTKITARYVYTDACAANGTTGNVNEIFPVRLSALMFVSFSKLDL